jgi:hypothetical protein
MRVLTRIRHGVGRGGGRAEGGVSHVERHQTMSEEPSSSRHRRRGKAQSASPPVEPPLRCVGVVRRVARYKVPQAAKQPQGERVPRCWSRTRLPAGGAVARRRAEPSQWALDGGSTATRRPLRPWRATRVRAGRVPPHHEG